MVGRMKYKFEWFIIGLVIFWILNSLLLLGILTSNRTHPYIEILSPLIFWFIAYVFREKENGT